MELIDTPELLKRLKISRPYLKKLIKEQAFPYLDLGSTHKRYDWNDVMQWMKIREFRGDKKSHL